MLNKQEYDTALRCIEIYIGDYSKEQQYASSVLLKMIFKERYSELMAELREVTGFKANDRNDSKVITWKKKIKKRGKCEICGSEEELVAHHIIPWEYSIAGRTDLENGMCLCTKCHKMMHNPYEYADYLARCKNERNKDG